MKKEKISLVFASIFLIICIFMTCNPIYVLAEIFSDDINEFISKKIETDMPEIKVGDVQVRAGKEITVPVVITKNSGIAGFSFEVNYDTSAMILKAISGGSVLRDGQISTNGNIVNWYTAENIFDDGTILNLTFEIAPNAPASFSEVGISLRDGKKNLVNENGIFVEAAYKTGNIEITKGIVGDVNGDDDITIADVVLLNIHVLGKTLLPDDKMMFADITGDEDITIADVIILNRHVLGEISLEATDITMFEGKSIAGSNMRIAVDDVKAIPGEQIDVPVRVSGNAGVAGFALSVNFPEGYTLNSITGGEILEGGTFTTNQNNCTWYTLNNIFTDGILMILHFTVGDNVQNGQIKVNVKDGKPNNLSDELGRTVPVVFTDGNITVASECEINGHKGGVATCISCAVCEVCGQEYGEKNPENHNEEIDEAVPATGASTGLTQGSHCKDCGKVLVKQKTVPVITTTTPVLVSAVSSVGGVRITWKESPKAEKYSVFRKTSASAKWTKIAVTSENKYLDKSVKGNIVYYYTVRCISNDGRRYMSGYNSTGKKVCYIAAPVINSLSNAILGVKVSWKSVSGASRYRVFRKESGESWKKIGDTSGSTYTDKGAKSGVVYSYTIRCISTNGKTYISGYYSAGKSIIRLSSPKLLNATSAKGKVVIKWSSVSGAEGYYVYRKTGSSGWERIGTATKCQFTDETIKKGRKYKYIIRAYRGNILSSYDSSGISATAK